MKTTKKEYSNGEVTVVYQPDLCTHSGVCVKGLPDVFQPGTSPWIKTQGASTEEIIRQIKKCPSRALSFYMNSGETNEDKEPIKAIETGRKVEVFKDGPLMVEGSITLVGIDGKREVVEDTCYFCRCGASKTKPYCDGSHLAIGFKD